MSEKERAELSHELVELFDLKKAKVKTDKQLNYEAAEAQKDIRLLTLMFRDGIPDISLKISSRESILWDAKAQKLLFHNGEQPQIIESTTRETRIRIRPFLIDLVKKAKEFYSDDHDGFEN